MSTRYPARRGAGSGVAYAGLDVAGDELAPAGVVPAPRAAPQAIGASTRHPPTTGQQSGAAW